MEEQGQAQAQEQEQARQAQAQKPRKPLVLVGWGGSVAETPGAAGGWRLAVFGWRYTTEQVNTRRVLPDGNQVLRTVEVTTVLAELNGELATCSVRRWSGDAGNRIVARRQALLRLLEAFTLTKRVGMTRQARRAVFMGLRARGVKC